MIIMIYHCENEQDSRSVQYIPPDHDHVRMELIACDRVSRVLRDSREAIMQRR